MKRKIEELIEKRKQKQQELKSIINDIAQFIGDKKQLKKNQGQLEEKFARLYARLIEFVTLQDQEWDAYVNNHSTMVFKSLQWKIEKLLAEYTNLKNLLTHFVSLEQGLKKLIDSIESKIEPEDIRYLKESREKLSPFQYPDFEHRFRGQNQMIKDRLAQYLPFFKNHDHILDIGCGRGEFLLLLKENGKEAEGIDISPSMLQMAMDNALTNIFHADALEYLKTTSSLAYGGIFSAQVIEHFPADYLQEVVIESFRILKQGSPIVFETINPTSLFALANIYFLDTSHKQPLHPEYMRYLLETSGFTQVEISYSAELLEEKLQEMPPAHESSRITNENIDKINKILFSPPVYAVTGIKA